MQITEQQQNPADYGASPGLESPVDFSRRMPELDGLRGIAIGMVLFFHLVTLAIVARPHQFSGSLYATTQMFWSGVDLFFVLSGFLIGGILLDSRNSPNYFSTFYIRRACRILPIYALFIILIGLAYRFIANPVDAPLDWLFDTKLPWYTHLTFSQNLWIAARTDRPAEITAITWSLAVEEQFYLVLPLIIRFVRRSMLPFIFTAGILLAPISRLFIVYHFRANLRATYLLLPCRMDSLLIGALCAYFLREPRVWSWLVKHRARVWTVFFILLAGMAVINRTTTPLTLLMVSVGYGWISLFYVATLILGLTDSQSLLSRALRWRWLAALGAVAYSVYLFHMAFYGLCMWAFTGHGWLLAGWEDWGVTLFSLAITISFGKLSWRYFEKPIVRWGHTWRY